MALQGLSENFQTASASLAAAAQQFAASAQHGQELPQQLQLQANAGIAGAAEQIAKMHGAIMQQIEHINGRLDKLIGRLDNVNGLILTA